MPLLALIVIGIAAGFLATRIMRINTDVPTTIAVGVLGALIGGLLLRLVIMVTGFAAGFLGAVLGAMALIWAYKTYIAR